MPDEITTEEMTLAKQCDDILENLPQVEDLEGLRAIIRQLALLVKAGILTDKLLAQKEEETAAATTITRDKILLLHYPGNNSRAWDSIQTRFTGKKHNVSCWSTIDEISQSGCINVNQSPKPDNQYINLATVKIVLLGDPSYAQTGYHAREFVKFLTSLQVPCIALMGDQRVRETCSTNGAFLAISPKEFAYALGKTLTVSQLLKGKLPKDFSHSVV